MFEKSTPWRGEVAEEKVICAAKFADLNAWLADGKPSSPLIHSRIRYLTSSHLSGIPRTRLVVIEQAAEVGILDCSPRPLCTDLPKTLTIMSIVCLVVIAVRNSIV